MGVAVLPPQDCLKHHHQPRRKPNLIPNPNRSSRRRRSPSGSPPRGPLNGPTTKPPSRVNSPPVMGQVRILKRGEDLTLAKQNDSVKRSEKPARSEPGMVLNGFYAGSGFVTSPPPSSLPLPAFFTKSNCGLSEAHNQEIESQLRRVLKLC